MKEKWIGFPVWLKIFIALFPIVALIITSYASLDKKVEVNMVEIHRVDQDHKELSNDFRVACKDTRDFQKELYSVLTDIRVDVRGLKSDVKSIKGDKNNNDN